MSQNNKSESVLVTGGFGFIGANLIPKLAKHYSVTVIDNGSLGHFEKYVSQFAQCIRADVRDIYTVKKVLEQQDYVVHLAANGSVIDSITDPVSNFRSNVEGTFNILQLAVETKIKHFVFASTGGAIIGNAEPPVDEKSLPAPISPYGSSKLCGEAYCHGFSGCTDLKTTILRFANIYGPYSQYKKGVLTVFIKAINENKPFTIFGDGLSSRDYLYVDDLCSAISTVLDSPPDSCSLYHLASGIETSIIDVAKQICEFKGKQNHPINYLPPRKGEIERNFASAKKASETFGFSSSTSFATGLKKTLDFFDDHFFK